MIFFISVPFIFSFLIASIELEGFSEKANFTIEESNVLYFVGNFSSGNILIDELDVDGNVFLTMHSDGYHSSKLIGSPELPELHRLIEIPQGSIPRIEILNQEYEVYDLNDDEFINIQDMILIINLILS